MNCSVSTKLMRRTDLAPALREQMFRLLQTHFDGVLREQFDADLAEKNWVLLVEKSGSLVGFTTLSIYEHALRSEPVTVVYSGDTIVQPDAWNNTALARGWISAVKSLSAQFGNARSYWLLLTSGFRTYRFLPVFWQRFYPKFDVKEEAPPLLRQLAVRQFGADYNHTTGIVRFERPQQLAGHLKKVPAGREFDPHIAFFLARNPRWDCGDELVCLTELSDDNLTGAGRRMTRGHSHELSLCGG